MKMQSPLEYKQENNGLAARQQPYQPQHHGTAARQQPYQQQRRIRVLEPTKHHHLHRHYRRGMLASGSGSRGAGSRGGSRGAPVVHHHYSGRRYHANLEGSRDLVLEANEFGLVWGVAHEVPDDDGEFKLRLLQRPSLHEQQEQERAEAQGLAPPQDPKQRPQYKCVEVSRESMEVLCHYEPKIRSLMLAHDKAIIFQNMDVQVYVMEEIKSEGFRVHFQDKRRTKVSLTYQQFLSFLSALHRVDHDYLKYKKKLKLKKYRLRAKGLLAQARCG